MIKKETGCVHAFALAIAVAGGIFRLFILACKCIVLIEMNLKATVAVCVILVCMMAVSQCSVLQIWGDWTQLDAAQLSMMFFVLALK